MIYSVSIALYIALGSPAVGMPVLTDQHVVHASYFEEWSDYQKIVKRYQAHHTESLKAERWVVQKVFYNIHRRLLKNYTPYATMKAMAEQGAYDCLTGSWVLGAAYHDLGFKVRVRELNFHTYVIVQGQGTYVIESTDSQFGVISNPDEIIAHEQRLADEDLHIWQQVQNRPDAASFLKTRSINTMVEFSQMAGLYYYNQAIAAWRKNAVKLAAGYLFLGFHYYQSERMEGFMKMLNEVQWAILGQDKTIADKLLKNYVQLVQAEKPVGQ